VPIQTEIGPTCVTISLGVVATSTPANFKLNEFIRRADQAMYHSKRLGRNRVTKWNEGIAPKRHA
jgi:PleD family two-component response regulator